MEYLNATTIVEIADELIRRVVKGIDGVFYLFIILSEKKIF